MSDDSRHGRDENVDNTAPGADTPREALTAAEAIEVARASAQESSAAAPCETTAGGTGTPAPPSAVAAPTGPVAPPPRTLATPIAWLALILVLLLAAGGFYLFLDLQRREALLLQRVQGLESASGQDTTTFDQMRDNLQRQIELELEGIAARQQRTEEDQQRAASRMETLVADATESARRDVTRQLMQEMTEQLDTIRQSLREQQQRISDLSSDDRQGWALAEARYLLRLANQRLIMTGDTVSAEALLRSADSVLRDQEAADLHGLREAVAADLSAVRAVPRLDIQGLYLRLAALIRQTDALVLFELPARAPSVEVAPAEDWRDRLAQGFDAAVAKLSEYIVVSRRDAPVEALMEPQYEALVRQNMRMLLEQAQVAMLSGNEVLYRQSLERAEGWVTQFFKADQQAAQAMAAELRQLRDERVSVSLPDLTASLQALDAVMAARLANGGP